ncbi:MAG: hypothetical protein AAF791_09125 [Bacteroidota bacterium]
MRLVLLSVVALVLAGCTTTAPESVEMEAPPWGWTEVSADLPDSFPELHRTVIATTQTERELHVAVETDPRRTTRALFVTVYERPSVMARLYRTFRFGDGPHTANRTNGSVFRRANPATLGIAPDLARTAEAAYTMTNAEGDQTGVSVRRCWDDLCAEAMAYGVDEGFSGSDTHHADLLAGLTVRR